MRNHSLRDEWRCGTRGSCGPHPGPPRSSDQDWSHRDSPTTCKYKGLKGLIKDKPVPGFEQWLACRPAGYVVFSDGSKTDTDTAQYGFVVFHHGQLLDWGSGQLGRREVFDAEIHGAIAGLKAARRWNSRLEPITVCMDNTSVIDCIGATAADSSQACFRELQKIGDKHPYLISVI